MQVQKLVYAKNVISSELTAVKASERSLKLALRETQQQFLEERARRKESVMPIEKATDRLWSGLSTDPKPDRWAPGILLLEIDTGVWWYTDASSAWNPCHPSIPQYLALMERASLLELDAEAKAQIIAELRYQLSALEKRVDADRKSRQA